MVSELQMVAIQRYMESGLGVGGAHSTPWSPESSPTAILVPWEAHFWGGPQFPYLFQC